MEGAAMRRVILILLLAVTAFAADRLYLKDGSYQLTNQYEVKSDRVRYYSTERGDWEEIPLEMVDFERTRGDVAERQAQVEADTKAEAEERSAERAARKQVTSLPAQPGAYLIRGEQVEEVKQAESKIVKDKKRSILKALSPIPLVPGKSTVELEGEHAPLRVAENRPACYFCLSDY